MRGLVALLLLSVMLAGCSSDKAEGSGFVTPETENGVYIITMTNARAFEPDQAKVPKGAIVEFQAKLGGCKLTSDEAGGPDSSKGGSGTQFNNGLMPKDSAYRWIAPESKATFHIQCPAYSDMEMTLRVG